MYEHFLYMEAGKEQLSKIVPPVALLAIGCSDPGVLALREDDNLSLATGNAKFDFDGDDVPEDAQWEIFLFRN